MSMRLRSFLVTSATLGGLLCAAPALAASITIEQRSDASILGTWTLVQPSGALLRSNSREERRTISNAAAGNYTIYIAAPDGATTTVRLLQNGTIRDSITGETLAFTLGAPDVTLQVAYIYQGSITVESIPTGAPFELTTHSGLRHTGVTPMTFRHLPPLYYSVNFGLREGCSVPRPIRRDLEANAQVVFIGEYRCFPFSSSASSTVVRSSSASSARSSFSSSSQATARIVHIAQQSEVLPAGSVRITVGIVNTGHSTLRNLTLSEQFDPALLSIADLPAGAMQEGNLVVWNIPSMYAGQRWNAHFTMKVASTVKPGDRIALTARISGEDLDGIAPEQLASTVTLGVASLPATGGAFDMLLALLGLLMPAPAIMALRRRSTASPQ